MENQLNLAWFLTTPFGSQFSGLPEDTYDFLYGIAAGELEKVLCNCPKLYSYAMAIQMSLLIQQMGINGDGASDASNIDASDCKAYVKSDKVYDVEREYVMKKINPEMAKATPAGILAGLKERCSRSVLAIGAMVVSSFPGLDECGCGDGWTGRFGPHADKADN